jgi:pyruvate/2-oxoglutarate dehydrogenase complex dihydrolipoamide acyltransferase (E2) component
MPDMTITVSMPALSPTMEVGTLAKWHVAIGTVLKSGDIIAEIETDKATMEVEAVDEGIVTALLVAEGAENVPVGTPIMTVAGDDEAAAPASPLGQAGGAGGGAVPPDPTTQARADLAASFQQAATDCLVDRTQRALAKFPQATALVVAGGVAANQQIRGALAALAAQHGLPFVAPPQWLCTDNAAMIAWAGQERLALGLVDGLDAPARPRWPLDPAAEAVRGAGVKA